MLRVGGVVVDFDGTACSADVSERLLTAFGDPAWPEFDEAVDRGEIGLREALGTQNAMIGASREELLAFAIANCPLDPTFAGFVDWLAAEDVAIEIVSDGFGFYVAPILEAAGLGHLSVVTNEQR